MRRSAIKLFLVRLLQRLRDWPAQPRRPNYAIGSPPVVQESLAVDPTIVECAERMAKVINESLQIAKTSKNRGTKASRLILATKRLADLKALVADYPYLRLPNLATVEAEMAALDEAFIEAGTYEPVTQKRKKSPAVASAGQDGRDGFEFIATMQLRVPLAVLERHGEIYRGHGDPPDIATEQWQGMWIPHSKSWCALGVDLPELARISASDIGYVSPHEYLPFLIAARAAFEAPADNDSDRLLAARRELEKAQWAEFIARHGGTDVALSRLVGARPIPPW